MSSEFHRGRPASSGLPPLPPIPRPGFPRPTSAYATWALLLGLLAIVCIGPGPILGIFAIVLGVLAQREIADHHGGLGGRALAIAGISLGVLSFAVFGGLVAMYMRHSGSLHTVGATYAPEVEAPLPSGSTSSAEDAIDVDPSELPGPALPTISTVSTIGTITVIDIAPGIASLSHELQQQRTAAAAHDQKLVVETVRTPCEPCEAVAQALGDPRMQKALVGVRLVRVDRDQFQEDLAELKIPASRVPGFFLVDSDLRVLDTIAGDEWDDDVPANIAPVLGSFVRGTYTKRRTPWKAPMPSGTLL